MLLPRLALLTACAAALSALPGCATRAPVVTPEPGLAWPAEWTAPYTPEAAELAGTEGWWRRFGVPQLDALVQQALAANPDLDVAAARVLQAQAQARIAGAALLPQADAELNVARMRQALAALPLPPSAIGGGAPGGGRGGEGPDGFIRNSFGVSLNVGWEADLWRRLGSQAEAAGFELAAAGADARAARASLAGQATKNLLLGLDLTILSMFGLVALAGVVVNDSLVLIAACCSRR